MYPLQLIPSMKPKVWGGNALPPRLGIDTPATEPIGEAWIVFGELDISNGELAGKSLDAMVAAHPTEVLGEQGARTFKQFPLLVKFLDARQNLSVQVHPDDAYAQRVEHEPFGKAEVWYILHAEPGAFIYRGTQREIGAADLMQALKEGRVDDVLERVPVQPGDVVLNMPGTIHALGGGIVIYELQQSSDITYRLYDWDRAGGGAQARELHIDKGAEVSTLSPLRPQKIRPITTSEGDATVEYLCACPYFAARLVNLPHGASLTAELNGFHVLTALKGALQVGARGSGPPLTIDRRQSVVIPASLGEYRVEASGGDATVIVAWIPDLQRDIIGPLEKAGIAREQIEALW